EGASRWVIRDLVIQNANEALVSILNHDLPSDNIVLEGNLIRSRADGAKWSQHDWLTESPVIGIVDEGTCTTVRRNIIKHVRLGMILAGQTALVEGNVIDNFGDDAIDITASGITLRRNRISNSHDIGDGNHNDAIQGWTVGGATNRDTIIDSNV